MEQVNPYMDRIMAALRSRAGAQASTSTTEHYCSPSLIECGLDNVDCQKCGNTGVIPFVDEFGCLRSRECGCMKRRLSIRRIDNSGLRDLLQKYSFDNYQTPTEEHAKIRNKALSFAVSGAEWFFICGKPGTGKTHICTAICSSLLDRGWELRYMVWRTDAAELKAMITDRQEYKTAMNRLRNAAVLYIDDFFKGSITVTADRQTVLTTIPYDAGWQITVDGKKAEPMKALGSTLAFFVDGEAGETHEIKLVYRPKTLVLGAVISITSLGVFIALVSLTPVLRRIPVLRTLVEVPKRRLRADTMKKQKRKQEATEKASQ